MSDMMSDTTVVPEIRPREAAGRPLGPAPRENGLADHALVQLTLTRFREFLREPEALFWVFIFPILLAAGLGLVFRNRPSGQRWPPPAAEEALPTGKVALLAEPGPRLTVLYRYDDPNPERPPARML